MPIPVNDKTWGLPAALSVMVNCPVLAPVAVGVNVTAMKQPLLAARVAGQLLV
jgi:hypothetical protein